MLYLKAEGNTVVQYPYSIGLLRKDNPMTSFPKKPSLEMLESFGVFPVTEVTPALASDQKLEKSWTPVLTAEGWQLQHQAVAKTAEDIESDLQVLKTSIMEAAQRNLDSAAKERGYDDAERCISYITSTNPTWKADADAMNTHRDAVWSKLFQIMGQVESGGRAAPTGFDEIEPELPVIDWTLA